MKLLETIILRLLCIGEYSVISYLGNIYYCLYWVYTYCMFIMLVAVVCVCASVHVCTCVSVDGRNEHFYCIWKVVNLFPIIA